MDATSMGIHGNLRRRGCRWSIPGNGEFLIVMEPTEPMQCFAPSQTAFRLSGGSVLGEFCPFALLAIDDLSTGVLCAAPQGETNDWDRRTSSSSPSRWRERKLSLRNQKADHLKRFPKWSVGYWLGYFSNLIQFSLTSHGFSEAFAWAWNHWFKCVCL